MMPPNGQSSRVLLGSGSAPYGPGPFDSAYGVRFPAITRFIASGVFETFDPPDREFIFGLDRILDGIEGLVTARSAPPPNPAE